MPKNIFKSIDSSFMDSFFKEKKNVFFPELKNKKIKQIKTKQISPVWATKTCLARYQIFFDDNTQRIVRGTAKTKSSKKNVWQIMNHLYSNAPASEELSVPRPLSYLKEINLLLYQEVPGIPLVSILEKSSFSQKKSSLKKAASWLSWLHKVTTSEKLNSADFIGSIGYQKAYFEIKKIVPEINFLPSQKVLELIDSAWANEKTIIHNDFYPGNSVVGKKTFFGIDFDRAGLGPSLMDVAALISFFDFSKKMWPYKMAKKESEILKKVFIEEYCSINNLDSKETKNKVRLLIIKSFLDQLHYYINFFLEGHLFMDKKTKNHFLKIIKEISIKIKDEK
jgi:thiamine kinase-like enzyme